MKKAKSQNLYKYFALDTDKSIKNFLDFLCGNMLYLANPLDFNDPFDCVVGLDVESLAKNKYSEENSPVLKALLKSEEIKVTLEEYANHTGIFCVSEEINTTLLWSHYGDSHKGIAVGINPKILENTEYKFSDVTYSDKYPTIQEFENADSKIELFFSRKHPAWQYEKEKRIIVDLKETKSDRIINFEKLFITKLYFGCRADCNQQPYKIILDWIYTNRPDIKLYNMRELNEPFMLGHSEFTYPGFKKQKIKISFK